jgi:poly(hydroxyalkanoate) depolymerase family esterase
MASLRYPLRRFGSGRPAAFRPMAPGRRRLTELRDFGSNPGELRALHHVPANLPPGAPLVVVLHGCTQTAAGYDRNSGWSRLADELGFAVLLPEQQRSNNPNLCFNWFSPGDSVRGGGEALSIRQMIAAMQSAYSTDPERLFVTGLSAGGAMTAVLLATYPELFAGGAVIAGLPFGTARSVPQALERMRGQRLPGAERLDELVRSASSHSGRWPTLSVWHGSADQTVSPDNAQALVDQWRGLHGLASEPDRVETIDGHRRRLWLGADRRPAIEEYRIAGMGHGTPLDTGAPGSVEEAGPHMLEAGISSTRRIAEFWGIGGPQVRSVASAKAVRAEPAATGARKAIEDALRTAGLLR